MIKFLVVGDLHGKIPKIHESEFNAIICPGDIFGDDLRPFIIKWIKEKTKKGYADFNKICPKKIEKLTEEKSYKKGRTVLKYLNSVGKPIFLVPGNWDQTPHIDGTGSNVGKIKSEKRNNWKRAKKGLKNIKDIEFKIIKFRGITFVGYGSTSGPETIQKSSKNKFNPEEEYLLSQKKYNFFLNSSKKLNSLFKKNKKIIFVSHNSPYNTKLDKINAPGTYADKKHYGSIITKNLITQFQPILCISGHIHEGFGKQTIGKTICLNAGFGPNINTLITLDEIKGKVISIKYFGKSIT